MSTFPQRLKELRKQRGLSQSQLAEAIGLTKQTISLWERGARRPEFDTMTDVADFFEVNLSYLLGTSDDPKVSEEDAESWAQGEEVEEIRDLANQMARLSIETRKIVEATIHEAYRIDRENGRLKDEYEVSVKLCRGREKRENVKKNEGKI